MKLKYYLRGLGIGILVTTVIFMIGIKVNGEKLMSDQDVISRAEELGMVKGEPQDNPKTVEELEEEQKKNQDKQKEENKKQEEGGQPKDEAQNEAGQKTEQKQPEVIEQVEINILPGEYSDVICQKLFDAGVIENKDEFKDFLDNSDYDNLIQPGTFTIPKGSAFEEIAKILTTKQEFR